MNMDIVKALEWAVTYVALHTPAGVWLEPKDWPRDADGEPDPVAIVRAGRAALEDARRAREGMGRGGERGGLHTGDKKRRGGSEHYRRLGLRAAQIQRERRAAERDGDRIQPGAPDGYAVKD